jgi:hypothetical protein
MATTEGSALAMASASTVSIAETSSKGETCLAGAGWEEGSCQAEVSNASETRQVMVGSFYRKPKG